MTLLLDTQALLWYFDKVPERLPPKLRSTIEQSNDVLVSAAVMWEIAIKSPLGKLETRTDLPDHVRSFGFTPLPITDTHTWAVRDLPMHHRDPFDRLLIAQASIENATLVTADPVMREYDVDVLWD